MPPRKVSAASPPVVANDGATLAEEVLVVQIDTRDPFEAMHGSLRTWPGGDNHDAQRKAYDRVNPQPAKRPYWSLTPLANAWECKAQRGWTYRYVRATPLPDRHASWVKIRWVLDAWDQLPAEGWVMVLDTDAWVRDAPALAGALADAARDGMAMVGVADPPSAEAEAHRATTLNGGFMCVRKDARVRDFLAGVWDLGDQSDAYRTQWPWEQACLCRAYEAGVAACADWVRVLPAEACNTPAGAWVAHCWYKDLAADLVVDDLLGSVAREALGVRRPTCELVVAKCDEDVSWITRCIPFVDRITVYDKNPGAGAKVQGPKITVVPLPNVGREAHTYAHHFVERYDDLCDAVVCTQGRYADHMSAEEFDGMMRTRHRTVQSRLDVPWTSTPMQHFGWTEHDNWTPAQPMIPMGMTMAKFFLKYIADDLLPETKVHWWANAVFAASAADVRRHPKARYEAIRDALACGPNPEAAHAMERFWKALLVPE